MGTTIRAPGDRAFISPVSPPFLSDGLGIYAITTTPTLFHTTSTVATDMDTIELVVNNTTNQVRSVIVEADDGLGGQTTIISQDIQANSGGLIRPIVVGHTQNLYISADAVGLVLSYDAIRAFDAGQLSSSTLGAKGSELMIIPDPTDWPTPRVGAKLISGTSSGTADSLHTSSTDVDDVDFVRLGFQNFANNARTIFLEAGNDIDGWTEILEEVIASRGGTSELHPLYVARGNGLRAYASAAGDVAVYYRAVRYIDAAI
jgi:hypothetical protein